MKIISVNLNGIRAAAKKGLYQWLEKEDADVVCLQELKAQPDQIGGEPFHPPGYHTYFHAAKKKGYSGVGIYCKSEPSRVQLGLGEGWQDVDFEGRYIQTDFDNLSVVSLYMPSGSSKEERQVFKYNMMERMQPLLIDIATSGRQWVICGDWNIAHKKRDIKNWRGNQKNSGFLPQERQWMDWLLSEQEPELEKDPSAEVSIAIPEKPCGLVDAFRVVNNQDEQFTWWSNRGQAWANNTGWRIDYQIISENLCKSVKRTTIYKEERFSDHAPLIVEYDL